MHKQKKPGPLAAGTGTCPPPSRCSASLPFLLASILPFLFAACANPVAPSGGPRDQTPPRIDSSTPAANATEVSGRTVEIVFSEYVERSSLPEALSVTPIPAGQIEYDWSGRRVQITFPEPLRDTTTYLLTIDTGLSDAHGVALEQPLTLAFSTGSQIDRGRLAGRVIGSTRGEGRGGFDVYAYSASAHTSERLPERPAYRTQTAEDGTFQFEYLREGPAYYVVALRDRNRDRQPDPLEAFAVPPRPLIEADSTGTEVEAPWIATARDPLAPELTRAAPRSDRRLALRFNEPVHLASRNPDRFAIRDTISGRETAVRAVYQRSDQRQQLVLRTDPMPPAPHRVRLLEDGSPVVTDTSGNAPALPAEAAFTPPERADTLGLRFLGFAASGPSFPPSGNGQEALSLLSENVPVVRFNQPPDSTRRAAIISARDTASGAQRPVRFTTDDGTTYRLTFDPPLRPGEVLRVQVDGNRLRPPRDTAFTRLVRRLPKRALGALSGPVRLVADTAASDTTGGPIRVELYAAGSASAEADRAPLRTTRADPDSGRFIFSGLPEGSYRFRAFLDRNRNNTWDGGRLAPYHPAEPITWSRDPLSARPRWETATEDTLRIVDSE